MSGLYSTRGFLRQMLNALLARHIANIPEIAQQRPWSMLVSECALGRQERYLPGATGVGLVHKMQIKSSRGLKISLLIPQHFYCEVNRS